MRLLTALLALTSLAAAHFTLDYPAVRGFDEDALTKFPCGGQDTVSQNRTSWPLTGGSIQLTMGHSHSQVQVLLALGNDPGDNYNIVLRPTFQEMGLGKFCLADVNVPAGLNLTEGTNATIQVVTNGDPSGGLYNCADITFTSTAQDASPSQCSNNTGVTTTPIAEANRNANGTTSGSSSTASGSPSSTSATAATSSPTNAAGRVMWETWGVVAGAAVGAAVLL